MATAVNLSDELDNRLSAYSGGMKQRLLLASALLGDPKLLILDEPTAGLDPKERVRLRELLAEMAQDRIILVATHVVADVETVATQVILLRAGKIVDAAPCRPSSNNTPPGQGLEDVYLNLFGEDDGKGACCLPSCARSGAAECSPCCWRPPNCCSGWAPAPSGH